MPGKIDNDPKDIASNCRYSGRKKKEAYRNSEFAPRVLAEHVIPVVMKVG